MKKTSYLICLLAVITCLAACGKNDTVQPPEQTFEQAEEKTKVGEGDKLTETSYAGTVNVVADDTMTLIVDQKEMVEFKLSEKAMRDIEHFNVQMGTRVVVDFETTEDGVKNAINVNLIKSE